MISMTSQQSADGKPAAHSRAAHSRAAQGRATRDQLVEVATGLFAEHGYEGTSIEAVLSAAGVSRGALYHHFAGKEALFEAVVQAVSDRVLLRLMEEVKDITDPVAALRASALAWVGLAVDPVIQRVVLVDAPSVLGWDRWRDMDDGRTLQEISDSDRLRADLVGPFAHMILAALDEIALVIARADDSETALSEGRASVAEFLARLLHP
jgi:AcrR family transcriptional regulator